MRVNAGQGSEDAAEPLARILSHPTSMRVLEIAYPLLIANSSAYACQKASGRQPLVLTNACKSSRVSPESYRAFVPYFMGKSARYCRHTMSHVGALCKNLADGFFSPLLNDQPVGQFSLDLRCDFEDNKNNSHGLFNNINCDFDTRIRPAPV